MISILFFPIVRYQTNLGAERLCLVGGNFYYPLERLRGPAQRQVAALRYVDLPQQSLEHLVTLRAVIEEAQGLTNVRQVRHKLPVHHG